MKRLDDEDKQIIRNISNIKDNGIKNSRQFNSTSFQN